MDSKNKVQTIVWGSAAAVLILVLLQINWIHQALKLREDQFDQQVKMASCMSVAELYNVSGWVGEVGEVGSCVASDNMDTQNCMASIPANVDKELLHEIVGKAMHHHGITLDYQFELVSGPGCGGINSIFSGMNGGKGYSCSLTPFESSSSSEYMRIVIPGKTRYILSQMKFMLGSSLLVVAFISLCFFFAARTVMKQKEWAERNTDFFNNMAHEFKTPLTNISLAGKMLSKGLGSSDPEKSARLLGVIHQENEKLKGQVDRVLQLACMERGDWVLEKEEVNVHEILAETLEVGSLQLQSRGGEVVTDFLAKIPNITGDIFHLKNVFANLLENAIKYSPESPRVNVVTANHQDGILVSVADTGMGMSSEKQEYIFEKFYRAVGGNVHDTKGFGLGLSYVKMIVDAHKGWIQVKSELGKGSSFHVFLPFTVTG